MREQRDVNTVTIGLIGLLGSILVTAASLLAIVMYYAVARSTERSRAVEAVQRIDRQVQSIRMDNPVARPWADAELLQATQEVALAGYGKRTMEIEEENGQRQVIYSIPIEQAMEAVLQERSNFRRAAGEGPPGSASEQKEVEL